VVELEDEADLPVPERRPLGRPQRGDVGAVEQVRPAVQVVERAEEVQQRALADAALADDRHQLPPRDREVEPWRTSTRRVPLL